MPQPPKKKSAPKKAEKPLAVDPFVERRVRDRMASFELANALAQANATPTRPNAPRDEYGFVSPYRAQAKARIAENEDRQFLNHTDFVPGEHGMMASSAEKNRVDTDRARVNAYALARALEERKRAKESAQALRR